MNNDAAATKSADGPELAGVATGVTLVTVSVLKVMVLVGTGVTAGLETDDDEELFVLLLLFLVDARAENPDEDLLDVVLLNDIVLVAVRGVEFTLNDTIIFYLSEAFRLWP